MVVRNLELITSGPSVTQWPIYTLPEPYAIQLEMYTIKCKFCVVQTILPFLRKQWGETVRACMVQQFNIDVMNRKDNSAPYNTFEDNRKYLGTVSGG